MPPRSHPPFICNRLGQTSPIQWTLHRASQLFFAGSILLGLPLLGVWLADKPMGKYFEFPPRTNYIEYAGFSWVAFVLLTVLITITLSPFIARFFRSNGHALNTAPDPKDSSLEIRISPPSPRIENFPWWGWMGVILVILGWVLAWNRFPWFKSFQSHTFTPLWVGYVLIMSGWTFRRTGCSLLKNRPLYFFTLFLLSAAFWWFFEYLNRFVQNWHYLGQEKFTSWEYFWHATFPFSTVLPAVLSTQEFLSTFSVFEKFKSWFRLKHSFSFSLIIFLFSGLGLTGIGIWPNILYPLLWISPLLITLSLSYLLSKRSLFAELSHGDWRRVVTYALAALVCGFFWEMWNYHSLEKWIYTVPYVNRFYIFEMPLLGYTGYLPFGLECAAIAEWLQTRSHK